MKKIGIDARLYSQTGIGVYLQNLLHYLEEYSDDSIIFYIYVLETDKDKIHFKKKNFIKKITQSRWHSFAEQTAFGWQLYQQNLDLMHFTYFSYPILYKRPFIATIHDLTILEFKTGKASTRSSYWYNLKYFFFAKVIKEQIKNARAIITPTQTVKQQIVKRFGDTYAEKIVPIYEGIDEKMKKAEEDKTLFSKFDTPFFLYVGNFYPHKNVERLIEAFSKIKEDVILILRGPSDFFSKRILEKIKQLEQDKRIIHFDTFTPETMAFFYKHALALVQPSLSEGFGLPLVEAAYFKTPIIASSIPVFQELLGKNYLPFDPTNTVDIQNKLEFFLKNKPTWDYTKLIEKYSFQEMTKETYKLYRQHIS